MNLNYLCLNGMDSLGSHSVIIEKGIAKPNKIQRVKCSALRQCNIFFINM